jgi:multidrug efflux pump
VLISGFVALTLTPMLCSLMLKRHHFGTGEADPLAPAAAPAGEPVDLEEAVPGTQSKFDAFFQRMGASYERTLEWLLRHRRTAMLGTLALVALIAVLFRMLPSELVPTEDRGLIFNIVRAPEGSTLEYTDRYVRQVEAIYSDVPEVEAMFTAVGLGFGGPGRVTDGFMFVRLKPYHERKRSQQDIVSSLFPRMFSIPGVLAFPINPPSLGGGFGSPVQFVIKADTYDELQSSVGLMMREAQQLGYLVNMDSDLKLNKPQLEIEIDRNRAAELGVSVTTIGSTLQTLLGGRTVTNFKRGNRQYDVILQVPPEQRARPQIIEALYVRGHTGLTQLASVVHVEQKVSPRELNHFNRERAATISANLAPGATLGTAIADLRAVAKRALPPEVTTDLAGQSREFAESSGGLYFLFGIALVFIFLVLAAQFESFIHPLTILLSVPLAVLGALLTLWIFGMSLNIYSQIGLIMLIGLVTKNSILIVEYANQRRERGQPLERAVVDAARIRLRPILMTALATMMGVLPIALGLGAGAESRKPLGAAVVGGMLVSTFLTLFVVPVLYTLLARFERERAEIKVKKAVPHGAAEPA